MFVYKWPRLFIVMPPPRRADALSDAFVLTSERPRKTKIRTEVANVTRDSDTTFKVKKVKGQLVADVLNSQHSEKVPPGE